MSEPVTESTTRLVDAAQSGSEAARERLFAHCRPLLQRWARGRLPGFARDLAETEDIVQVTLIRASNNLERFEHRGSGSFLAYLRTILLNAVKEELRRSGRRPEDTEKFEAADGQGNSVLSNMIGLDTLEPYERALARLSDDQREAVVLRLEFGLSFADVAAETGAPSADAARMQVSRALVRLAELMKT